MSPSALRSIVTAVASFTRPTQTTHLRVPHAVRMSSSVAVPPLSEEERFEFDLNGFLVVRGVFSSQEIADANDAVDKHASALYERSDASLRNAKADTPMSAAGPRLDMGGMLFWEQPYCNLFRNVLTHPKLVPYYTALCGEGYRMDHQPLLIAQQRDSEGFSLHGGPVSGDDGVPCGRFNPELQYRCFGGEMWTSLLAVSVRAPLHTSILLLGWRMTRALFITLLIVATDVGPHAGTIV